MEESEIYERCEKLGIARIGLKNPQYPPLLKQIVNPPEWLYAKGRLELLQSPMMAVVGARKASMYGLDAAKAVATRLSESGFCVISGMALGVDSAAHEAVLARGGDTIAVLGCGIDICYPAVKRPLYNQLLQKGLIISPFAPGESPLAWHFPVRNRVISGSALGVVVVEAGIKSGSLSTAESALDAGREVYCVPGSLFLDNNQGANRLLNDGAQLVGSLADLPGPQEQLQAQTARLQIQPNNQSGTLTEAEKSIYASISDFGTSRQEIAQKTNMAIHEINALISRLKLKGLLKSDMNGLIYKTR